MKKVCLSLFDGISCLQLALKQNGIKPDIYYSSEIDESAMTVTQHRFPNTIQLGDVQKISKKMIKEQVWLISAGSPCQDFSVAGKRKGMKTTDGEDITTLEQYLKLKSKGVKFSNQSYLLWEFIRLVKLFKPKYYFLENVTMPDKWKYIITRELNGVEPLHVNSSLFSAQNRKRLYWTNISVAPMIDRKIMVGDVIPNAVNGWGRRGREDKELRSSTSKWIQIDTTRTDGKANCIVTKSGNTSWVKLRDGSIQKITIEQAEALQTLPKNYTNVPGLTVAERWKCVGNGWTIAVVSHLLKRLKKDLTISK